MSHPAQQIRFCTSHDGTRIAYAMCGSGPPLLRGAHYLSHLEFDWESPVWRPWLDLLARHHTLIRYDQRGCGLSDREGVEFSFEKYVEDLEAVIDAVGIERFRVFGVAGGGTTGLAYASRHPGRVSHLILYGCYVQGRIARATTSDLRREAETQLGAMELGWANENPAFRQLITSLLLPDGTPEQFRSFNDQIRRTVPPANATKIMRTFWKTDLSSISARVRCPTLVFHSRDDARVPFEQGRLLAGLIPNASFVPLDSRNHLIMENEPAWQQFVQAFEDFLPASRPAEAPPSLDDLTSREKQILELVARGLDNNSISGQLKISEKTIRNHVSAIFGKMGVNSRAQAVAVARDAGLGRRNFQ